MQGKVPQISETVKKEIELLASKFCTMQEIVSCLNLQIKVETFKTNFGEIYQKGRELGCKKLRFLQLASAEKGNVVMQIWLGKQYLGQADISRNIDDIKIVFEDADISNTPT